MAENCFRKCETVISDTELDELEKLAGYPLPADFRAHYLRYNGGVPERTWWDSLDDHPPCAVVEFRTVGHGKHTVESLLRKLRSKKIIPEHLLPFAVGASGQYFCLDLKNGSVLHYVTGNAHSERSMEENIHNAQRKLSQSFNEFVKGLVGADEIDPF